MSRALWLLLAVAWGVCSCERAPGNADTAPAPRIITTAAGDEMVLIPAGSFRMGSSNGHADEAPVHEVKIDAFLMDRCEVTQEQLARVISANGSHWKGPKLPVEMITWVAAATYCNLRSEAEGLQPCYNEDTTCNFQANGYRLPTEAEWEYACRAGATGDYSFASGPAKLGEYAWYKGNAGKRTHPVRKRKPNAWGLYDMHGNVAEWCNDVYAKGYYRGSSRTNPRGPAEGEKRVLRGGAGSSSAKASRSAMRVGENPGFHDACFPLDAIGFRCVRRVPSKTVPSLRPATGRRPTPIPAPKAATTQASGKTGFVYGEIYLRHDTGKGHPERPQRLTAITERLGKAGLMSKLIAIRPRPAADKWLATVHTPKYVARIQKACREGAGYVDSRDTPVSKDSFKAAVHAAGGVLAAIDAVMAGKVRNAFCAVRPPGHHALKDKAMGFCLFNNVAVAARYIQKKHALARVLIVDWDVHHGNGTQAMFYADPTVLYFGVHRHPFYPGTGAADERGEGKAVGTTLNVPLRAGSGDREFAQALTDKLVPAARKFRPDFVLISAGFDAHQKDPLGGMKVTAEGYARLTRIVKGIAAEHCRGRLVSVLEGGYSLEGLADSCEAHVRALMK
ncbi:MAG: SUMF1/EgtB/PvdO family nonheme iron enzyme [Dehalococcoidia bacterium]